MLDKPVPLSSRYSYHAIFSDVCKLRFNHLVTRLYLVSMSLEAILLGIWAIIFATPLRGFLSVVPKTLLLLMASLIIALTRKNYLHMRFLGYSSLLTHCLGQLLSIKFIVYYFVHAIGTCLISKTIPISEIGPKHTLTFYYIQVWLVLPLIYTLQHVLLDLDKLSFNFDLQYQPPAMYISGGFPRIVLKSCILSIAVVLVTLVTFPLLSLPWNIGFLPYVKICALSLFVFINFGFINLAFDAHMSIGCLHKGKPLSSLSSTPVETLISGLSSKRPFTKLTAFQELSYRATSVDTNLRVPIYQARNRDHNLWGNILNECLKVIQETNETVASYMDALDNSLSETRTNGNQSTRDISDDINLFGNESAVAAKFGRHDIFDSMPGSIPYNDTNFDHTMVLSDDNVLLNRSSLRNKNRIDNTKFSKAGYSYPSANHIHRYNEPIMTHDTLLTKLITRIFKDVMRSLNAFFFPSTSNSRPETRQLSIIESWQVSKTKHAKKLVPLPVCHGGAIISLMGFLINALQEDPKGGIVASVGVVLKSLERSVGALGRFADWKPHPYKSQNENNAADEKSQDEDVVTILYDLSIVAFLEIVLKYNVLLNDVFLDEDVVKLSKWVLEMCG